jgi:hypothetical protein
MHGLSLQGTFVFFIFSIQLFMSNKKSLFAHARYDIPAGIVVLAVIVKTRQSKKNSKKK